ncbi:unnamed protein product [Candida verbasci]|uniref:Actin-related protein 4 n=1 Tax=Candida verbasci TaxID=1227364 RepID=A0A9W4U2A7_9ASCO|nr:unnamed protein product [Candida verbasci]
MSNTVYGGDEVNAIILDPGTYNTRIGYAGDDFPKIITPSYYGEYSNKDTTKKLFGQDLLIPRSNFEIKPLLKEGLISDWDSTILQFNHLFNQLKIQQSEQPLLLTEPIWSSTEYKTKLIESVYENWQFSGFYVAKVPTCISFQQGRPNCLVVDLGHDTISVTPVVDGICLIKNSMKTNYSGKFLNSIIEDYLQDKNIVWEPSYKIKSKTITKYPEPAQFQLKSGIETTNSYSQFLKLQMYHEFKELLMIPEKGQTEFPKRIFELSTGQQITLEKERFQFADCIFEPKSYEFKNKQLELPPSNGEIKNLNPLNEYRPLKRFKKSEQEENETASTTPNPDVEVRGLSQLITHSLNLIDIDLRSSIANNIIVTGGVSLIPGLTEKLYHELTNNNPGLKIRLHAVGNQQERINQSWIGGSVLASLGTFHQMWVTKQEYEEVGIDRLLNQRFR